jgi:hypothetical protein
MSAEGYTPGQAGDFSAPQDAAPSGGFAQGQAGDFSDLGGSSAPDGSIGAGAGTGSGGWGMLNNVWKATTQLARDVGAGALLDDVKMGMNKVKANQLGDALVLVEELPEVEKALAYGRETKLKYEQLFRSMMDGANDAARTATPLRRAGAAFIRCAGISDKVAREMATSGREGFYKETPTYQQDLNEALLVTSGAMLYHADRQQAFFTTDTTIEASKANFEQGTYSTKYYVKREAFGPGPMAAACKVAPPPCDPAPLCRRSAPGSADLPSPTLREAQRTRCAQIVQQLLLGEVHPRRLFLLTAPSRAHPPVAPPLPRLSRETSCSDERARAVPCGHVTRGHVTVVDDPAASHPFRSSRRSARGASTKTFGSTSPFASGAPPSPPFPAVPGTNRACLVAPPVPNGPAAVARTFFPVPPPARAARAGSVEPVPRRPLSAPPPPTVTPTRRPTVLPPIAIIT